MFALTLMFLVLWLSFAMLCFVYLAESEAEMPLWVALYKSTIWPDTLGRELAQWRRDCRR